MRSTNVAWRPVVSRSSIVLRCRRCYCSGRLRRHKVTTRPDVGQHADVMAVIGNQAGHATVAKRLRAFSHHQVRWVPTTIRCVRRSTVNSHCKNDRPPGGRLLSDRRSPSRRGRRDRRRRTVLLLLDVHVQQVASVERAARPA